MFQSLLTSLLGNRFNVKVALSSVDGFTGGGDVRFYIPKKGPQTLIIRLHGAAGREAELFANDTHFLKVPLQKGRAFMRIKLNDPIAPSTYEEGARIEIRQNGDVILTGVCSCK